MPAQASAPGSSRQVTEPRSLRKRSVNAGADPETTPTPTPTPTPSKRRRRRSPSAGDLAAAEASPDAPEATPRKSGKTGTRTPVKPPAKSIFATPVKNPQAEAATPSRRAADQSARRKSARALIERAVGSRADDDDDDDGDGDGDYSNDTLIRQIYEDSDAQDSADDGRPADPSSRAEAATPSSGAGAAGQRAEASASASASASSPAARAKRATSPTPPRDLPPHELYFAHNKPGKPTTSDRTLASLALLTHDEYFALAGGQQHEDPHAADVAHLENLHAELFPQWAFELSQGYSVCLYGFGSKRALLRRFAHHLHLHAARCARRDKLRIVAVNGYARALALRDVLACVGAAIAAGPGPGPGPGSSHHHHRLPTSTPAAMVSSILAQLAATDVRLALLVSSVDAAALRKPAAQGVLARLAAHPQVSFVCSADTPDFPLLWDIALRSAFDFVFHDCTTFAPFAVELDVVDDVHELLGRAARRVSGREGVAFVLKSLPENAKNLFRLLVGEVLVAMEEEGRLDDEPAGVEYRMVYNKAVEEFICSSEMAFRTLLKEFHDHQMITSRKDALGTELLSVPFPKDELEAILEDLMS
ncbi:uncharacterized protein UV8b_04248 [Ustilaginoidea virens]|uniref:Origin recognition complex subunit 2 n=1 Tax=Ustilaginoidea virens TaxID=1159556 RepID=A0A8E5HR84_USTVR|nr:uncharacterized protein UV8b_04248 [Ustilaginoidea virens]QUC20007.1 hypothetical protein UV8b_04248 [Ustilaginoidea virens]